MKPVGSRKIEQLVEDKIRLAALRSRDQTEPVAPSARWPLITISREPCAGGTTLGRSVRAWGQMGEITQASREGCRMGPPAERE